MARFRYGIDASSCQMALSLSLSLRFEGVSASPVPVALDAIDPWQTLVTPAVEAVEHCSCPLLFQRSWCVHACMGSKSFLIVTDSNGFGFVKS